jgi:hypothetical protein
MATENPMAMAITAAPNGCPAIPPLSGPSVSCESVPEVVSASSVASQLLRVVGVAEAELTGDFEVDGDPVSVAVMVTSYDRTGSVLVTKNSPSIPSEHVPVLASCVQRTVPVLKQEMDVSIGWLGFKEVLVTERVPYCPVSVTIIVTVLEAWMIVAPLWTSQVVVTESAQVMEYVVLLES